MREWCFNIEFHTRVTDLTDLLILNKHSFKKNSYGTLHNNTITLDISLKTLVAKYRTWPLSFTIKQPLEGTEKSKPANNSLLNWYSYANLNLHQIQWNEFRQWEL